jgi:D-sedoheptulose 7-phosphate isomerase
MSDDAIARIRKDFDDHAAAFKAVGETLMPKIEALARAICDAFDAGRRLYTMGNGGSAADALHFAEELLGRYRRDRRPLPAQSFVADPTGLTCITNDFGWEQVFARQVEGLVQKGDVVVGISTSGNSPNVVKALEVARAKGAITAVFTGATGGKCAPLADHLINVPSPATARIQEMHILIIHVLCERIDDWVLGT